MLFVLDACAMIAYVRDEPGSQKVEDCLVQEPPACLAHSVNVCEVFYDFLKRADEDAARKAVDDLRAAGLIIRDDLDEAFWQQAGRHKVHHRIPLPDAFALALAERFGAELLTSDHRDFDTIAKIPSRRITFIR